MSDIWGFLKNRPSFNIFSSDEELYICGMTLPPSVTPADICSALMMSPISLPNQLEFLWNFKHKLMGSQLIILSCLFPGYYPKWLLQELGHSPIFLISIYLCQFYLFFFILLGSLWNFKLKLLWTQLIIPLFDWLIDWLIDWLTDC